MTYFDRGKSVTRQINAISNGEYKMPSIGQVVSVSHNSNGAAAGTTTGTVWNKTNTPAEGYKGLFRKEYAARRGLAYERYDENTGVYTQYVNRRTGAQLQRRDIRRGERRNQPCGGRAVSSQEQRRQHEPERQNRRWHRGGDNGKHRGRNLCEHRGRRRFECDGGRQVHIRRKKGAKIEVEGGDAEITINGATVKVTEAGDVEIGSSTKISLTAPEINATAASGGHHHQRREPRKPHAHERRGGKAG